MITTIKKSLLFKMLSIFLAFNLLFVNSISANEKVTLNAGTSIILETVSFLKSDLLVPGQLIDFKVKYDVKVDSKTVIKAGTIAKGQVTRSQKAKGLGKAGHLEIQVSNVAAVDGTIIPLASSNLYQEGEDKESTAIVLGLLICILFLTMKGKNAEIPPGTEINASSAGTVYINID